MAPSDQSDPGAEGSGHKDRARLAAVRRYDILDAPPDGAFDRITALAARLFAVPVAIVSIVDTDRIWFTSRQGLDVEQIGRDLGLCASAINQDEPWVVTDALGDPRVVDHPLVTGEFGLRFYAGAPLLTSDGLRIGTLCVLDLEPRPVTEDEIRNLEDLAAIVMDELEMRLSARQLQAMSAELQARAYVRSEQAEQSARTDPLTGLRNRRALDIDLRSQAHLAQAAGTDVALVMIDVDGLKGINDRQGHAIGDDMLRAFAQSLHRSFRASDLLYRIGGDEFTVAIGVKESRDLAIIDRHVENALDQMHDSGWTNMSASSGIALLTETDWSIEDALGLADARMYQRKLSARQSHQRPA